MSVTPSNNVDQVIEILRQAEALRVHRSAIENAIKAVPDANPVQAAYDLLVWASSANFKPGDAAPLLLTQLRRQTPAASNGKPTKGRECAECRQWKPYELLLQGRCKAGCYDGWADRQLAYHDRLLAEQVAAHKRQTRRA